MQHEPVWQSHEVLAYTEHDGPGRAPRAANRGIWFVLAGVLTIVFSGMVLGDTLCPEHRAWVQALGAFALIGTGTAIVGLIRGWAAAPVITLVSAIPGVIIGLIDAAHDVTRGQTIAVAFGLVVVGALFLSLRQLLLAKWDDQALHQLPSVEDVIVPTTIDTSREVVAAPASR